MKRALVVLLAVAVLFVAGLGIYDQLQKQRRAAEEVRAAQAASVAASNAPRRGKRNLYDPAAREALALVGADAKAEEYWLKAINNPSVPANERQDLIEDLNEEGFADPKSLSAQDLPLIEKRIAILEKLEAMDDVNAAAIKEAHKDLTKMRDRLRP
jgi:hypothetical protein